MWSAPGGAGCEKKACLTQPDWCLLMRPQPTPPWRGLKLLPRGIRLTDHVPHGHWKTITFIAGLRRRAMVARFALDGPMNSNILHGLLKHSCSHPQKRGDIVMMDSLPVQKAAGVREVIEVACAKLRNHSKYSWKSILSRWRSAKLKAYRRKAAERTIPHLSRSNCASWPHSVRSVRRLYFDIQPMI